MIDGFRQALLDAPTYRRRRPGKAKPYPGSLQIEAPIFFAIPARASLSRHNNPLARLAKFT